MPALPWPSCPESPVMAVSFSLFFSACPVLAVLFKLSCFNRHFLGPFFLSCPGCLILVLLCSQPYPSALSCQTCPGNSVLAVLSWKSCHASLVLPALFCLSCSHCHLLAVRFWLYHASCPVPAFLFWFVLSFCLCLAILSKHSCPDRPVLAALSG
jgi:hypothetical protein